MTKIEAEMMGNEEPRPLEIGRPEIRGDALAKASGREPFAVDHYPENLVWAGAARAGVPHGRLLAVDISAAQAVPGVLKV
ncbi:MAG TPA: hypothetical protein VF795_05085, partial [Desulfuromonadaceae bacterium]